MGTRLFKKIKNKKSFGQFAAPFFCHQVAKFGDLKKCP
jgi:hypothetical protein